MTIEELLQQIIEKSNEDKRILIEEFGEERYYELSNMRYDDFLTDSEKKWFDKVDSMSADELKEWYYMASKSDKKEFNKFRDFYNKNLRNLISSIRFIAKRDRKGKIEKILGNEEAAN